MKQGGGTIDASALASGRGLSSGSPSVAPVWSSPTTVKTSVGTTGSYIPSYTSWYPTTHQESMQQSQLMWTGTSTIDSAMARVSGWWRVLQPLSAAQHWKCTTPTPEFAPTCRQLTQWPPHTDGGKQRWIRRGAERQKRHTMRPRARSPWQSAEIEDKWISFFFFLAAFYHISVSFYFFFFLFFHICESNSVVELYM